MGMIIGKKKAPPNVNIPKEEQQQEAHVPHAMDELPNDVPEQEHQDDIPLDKWLADNLLRNDIIKGQARKREIGTWIEIRLFISSTFIDTHSERDVLIQRIIPSINRKLAPKFIRVIPVDLRWGVLSSETSTCQDLQKTCLNQIDKCRENVMCTPWFLCVRTNRYGWVQDDYMPSHGFEQPELFQWIENFGKYGKNVSITSLECVHAVQSMKIRTEAPTVFFYKREIIPPSEGLPKYPEQYRWIFDFEYVKKIVEDPVLKYQYNVHPKAEDYEKDHGDLDKYIQTQPHVKWFNYQAIFKDAKITCKRENAKSFGVGYVTELDTFQNQVEQDLMDAILANYDSVYTAQVDKFDLESIQHENAIKFKASTFVGRTALVTTTIDHCTTPSNPNTMILHGEPGCGKSGLLAAVAHKSIQTLRDNGHFLFIHAVDTCPGSNLLEGMLRRMQVCLRRFRIDLGETKLSKEFTGNSSELKQEYHSFLVECAEKYPEKLFVVIVDAVNQFHSGLGAWDMWWLPQSNCPKNLKFVISTLNKENDTFANACNVSPEADCVAIENMSNDDLQEMVRMTLSRFNKKLTDYEDSLLGNQMEKLLSKSKSPLYLIAACEALRKFGIFERVTHYIESLPATIPELFGFLLDEWSLDYGDIFVKDVAALLCLSKDGLLENQINDLLHYNEQQQKGDGEQLYDANFPRIYDSIAQFLAAGGGGYLRFFHDQLKYAVQRKFMEVDDVLELTTQKWMRDFFDKIVKKQCCESPAEEPPAYFEHALKQLVYHQLAAHSKGDSMDFLKNSLRNIYFVKLRIIAQQHQDLSDEYGQALEKATSKEDNKSIKEWQSFVQLYTPYIREFPTFCFNMAITQAPTSFVNKDTAVLDPPTHLNGYPLYWSNIPAAVDPMVVKYPHGGIDCSSTDTKGDIVAIANKKNVVLLDQSSGEPIQKLINDGSAVCLTKDGKHVMVGNNSGKISLWDIATGTMESSADVFENAFISWVECTDEFIIAGTSWEKKTISWNENTKDSWIAVADLKTCTRVRSWCAEKPGYDYCYHKNLQMIFSAHKDGVIVGWDLQGSKLCSTSDAGRVVYSLASHPTQNKIISGSEDLMLREWSVSASSMELCNKIQDTTSSEWGFGGNWSVSYDHDGERILSTEPQSQSLRIYSSDGKLLDELRGHSDCINKITLVPGGNQVITCDRGDESILWELPNTSITTDKTSQMVQEKVGWCAFSVDGSEFVTASEGWLRVYDTISYALKLSVETCDHYRQCGAIHPDGKHVVVISDETHVAWYQLSDLGMVSNHLVLPTDDGSITCLAIDEAATKLLVTECRNHSSELSIAKVLDISDVNTFKEGLLISDYGARLFSCAINNDGLLGCISGHSGTRVFDLENGDVKYSFNRGCHFVKFHSKSDHILYSNESSFYTYDPTTGQDVKCYKGCEGADGKTAVFLHDESHIMALFSDGSLRMYDVESEENVYGFLNHRAQGYTSLAVHKSEKIFLAANENSMVYILKTER